MKEISEEQKSDELLAKQEKTLMDYNLHQFIVNNDLRDIKRRFRNVFYTGMDC